MRTSRPRSDRRHRDSGQRRDRTRLALAIIASIVCAGCWGDAVPSLDQVGAMRPRGEDVVLLFAPCAGEELKRVRLERTDEDFEEKLGVLWAIEADGDSSTETSFAVGSTPPGFRETVALDEPLPADAHVQAVITSSTRGTIPMSFDVADLRRDEVLVRHDTYRSRSQFEEQAAGACGRST